MSLPLNIAKRFIIFSKFQSLLIIFGIAVGVSVQIFIGILIDSLQADLLDKTVGNSPHITIASEENDLNDYKEIISRIDEVEGIKDREPLLDTNAFLTFQDESAPILLRGINVKENEIYDLKNKLEQGVLPKAENEVAIGIDLAEKQGLEIGNEVSLFDPNNNIQSFIISGIFDYKVENLNNLWVFTTLETVQEYIKDDNKIGLIEIQVDDVFAADSIANEIEDKIDSNNIEITNWKETNEQLLSALNGQGTSSLVIQVCVLFAVVIAITSILTVTVMQKSKQIGILKAMGIKNKSASKIFIWQGTIFGIIGSILGTFLGLALFFSFTYFTKNEDGTALVEPYIRWAFLLSTTIIVIIASTLAGLIPARKSSKLNPVEIIKNG